MNILYIGSSGTLSLVPFKKLLSSEHSVTAVGVFNPIVSHNKIIALENSSLSLFADQKNIPVIDMSQSVGLIVEQCKKISIDIILMSCYGKRLPEEVVALAKSGCFNMHPSLLPSYRGPEPIFWQMKYESKTGVSWHYVTRDFDAGDVASINPGYKVIFSLFALGVFASSFAFVLFTYVIKNIGISKGNFYTNLVPVFASIAAFFILDERFTVLKIVGMAVIILGVALSEIEKRNKVA